MQEFTLKTGDRYRSYKNALNDTHTVEIGFSTGRVQAIGDTEADALNALATKFTTLASLMSSMALAHKKG